MMRVWVCGVALIALGVVVGPLAMTAGVSAWSARKADPGDEPGGLQRREVADMVAVYLTQQQVRQRGMILHQIVPPGDGAECGYDPDTVFPGGIDALGKIQKDKSYVDYAGYFWLNRARVQTAGDAIHAAIVERLATGMSRFEAEFLRRCMGSALYGDLCFAEVDRRFLDAYGALDYQKARVNSDYLLFGHEREAICTFVDGVAARRGIPLAKRPPDGER